MVEQGTADHFDKRIGIAVVIGNTIAWADFALYAYFSPVLARLFFPFTNYSVSLFFYFIIFALAFLFRPIGAAVAGSFADRYGRKNTLLATVIVSCVITALIGFLPDYEAIGIFSPILLAFFRILQTIAIAAEPTNSSALLIESTSQSKRGLLTSLVMSGIFLGFFLGVVSFLLISTLLDAHQIQTWGWRLPFIASLFIGAFFAKFILGTKESPVFLKMKKEGRALSNPIKASLHTQTKLMFVSFGYSIMMAMGNYLLIGYFPSLLNHQLHLSLIKTNLLISISFLVTVVLIPICGFLSDKLGRRPIMATGALLFIVISYPLFYLISSGDLAAMVIALVLYGIALAPVAAVMPTAISEMFPAATRCTGGAIGYNVGLVIFGGTSPIIAEALVRGTGHIMSLFWFITAVAVIHLVFVMLSKETKNIDIRY